MSAEDVRRWFRANGITISAWAARHDFNPSLVYAVLKGQRKCLRGESHKIAVALKLKR